MPTEYERFYTRHLPHQHPEGASFFVNTRLHGSIPLPIKRALADEAERDARALDAIEDSAERAREAYLAQRKLFTRWDAVLDNAAYGPTWLKDTRVAKLVVESLHFRNGTQHDLIAYCIMSNHIHVVLAPLQNEEGHSLSLTTIMQSIKGYTGRESNKLLGRSGAFWEHESYDHWARDAEELRRIIVYTINNPVKAGLVKNWQDWPWSYCKYPYL
jgi:putative transposase